VRDAEELGEISACLTAGLVPYRWPTVWLASCCVRAPPQPEGGRPRQAAK
jgi:hypothetical protein